MIDYRTMAERRSDYPQGAEEVDLGRLYLTVLSRWPIILAAAVAAALLALGLTALLPHRFQSTAELTIGIDHSRVELLDEDIERNLLRRVQDLLLSDQVLRAAAAGLPTGNDTELVRRTLDDFRANARLTRVEARWLLMVSDPDPSEAAALANAWASSALEAVEASQQHAWRVAELQGTFFEVACRPSQDGLWLCDEVAPDLAGADLQFDLLQEIRASSGIAPIISYGLLSEATAPEKPISTTRAVMVASGTGIGFLIGLGLLLRASPHDPQEPAGAPAIGRGRSAAHTPESENH